MRPMQLLIQEAVNEHLSRYGNRAVSRCHLSARGAFELLSDLGVTGAFVPPFPGEVIEALGVPMVVDLPGREGVWFRLVTVQR